MDSTLVTREESTSSHDAYDGLTFVGHMVAGATAGTVEHTFMYPVDTIKTRMQALAHPGQRLHGSSVINALRAVLRREGVTGLYRGVGAVALSAGPAHALHFAVYEVVRSRMMGGHEGYNVLATGAGGAVATILNDAVMTPADVIKQRLQVAHSPYKGLVDCTLQVLRREGISAFYKSYSTTVVMNVPFAAMYFGVYEGAKELLVPNKEEEGLMVQLVAGGLAGGAAAAVTNPLDVVKTRLQTEGVSSPSKYAGGLLPALRQILAEEGWPALWRGLKPRVMFNVPAAAVCWGTYESMKTLLRDQ